MLIIKQKAEIKKIIEKQKSKGHLIGFVPTMGALHSGHIRLINQSKNECDFTVCSIFVNPLQFNNQEDYLKYPNTLDQDILLLEEANCDLLYYPNRDEVFNEHIDIFPNLNKLDSKLEGEFRPGHFHGVVQVVYELLKSVNPDILYMGLKDFQQQAIINQMILDLKLSVKLHAVETQRAPNGLALSSRNQRLSLKDRNEAGLIYRTLNTAKTRILAGEDLEIVLNHLKSDFELPNIKLEYLIASNAITLTPISKFNPNINTVLLIAVWWGEVRLIDNMIIN